MTNISKQILKPSGEYGPPFAYARLEIAKNPVIGSDSGESGLANALAPAEITLRYNGQSLSIELLAAYRVPMTKSCDLII